MARRPKRGESAENPAEVQRGHGDEAADEIELLAELEPGQLINVKRQEPHYARGYLGKVEVPSTGVQDLLDVLRSEWGGGRFLLQPLRREGAKLVFSRGSRVIDLAGEPIFDGRRYRNGRLDDPPHESVQHAPTPVVVQQPVPVQSDSSGQLQATLLAMLSKQLGGANSSAADTIGLVKALLGTVQTTNDPFGSIERAIALSERLAKSASRGRRDDDDDDDEESGSGMSKMMEAAIMKQFFGDNTGANPPPPMPPNPYTMAPPVPGAMWDPRVGAWVIVQQAQAPQPPPPPSPPPRPTAGPRVVENPTVVDDDDGEENDDVDPITPDDVLAELEHLGPDKGKAFLEQIMAGLGIPVDMLERLANATPPAPKVAGGDGA